MGRRRSLSRERIEDAAMALLDAQGVGGFTMRRLATELGADPMAVYHYFADKQALLHALVGRFLAGCVPPVEAGPWRERLAAVCRGFRAHAHTHPGAFMAYTEDVAWADHELDLHEALHAALQEAGFGPDETVFAARLVLGYAENFAWCELMGWIGADTPEDIAALDGVLAQGRHPVTAALRASLVEGDADAEFEFGLETLLCGLERRQGGYQQTK